MFTILGTGTRTVTVGESFGLQASASKSLNFDPTKVTWRTSNSSVVEFIRSKVVRNTYPYGYFKAKKVGTATVTASCCGNTATCQIIVENAPEPLTAISFYQPLHLAIICPLALMICDVCGQFPLTPSSIAGALCCR